MKSFPRKDFWVGLDLGSSSIKLAVFFKKGEALEFLRTEWKGVLRSDNEAEQEQRRVTALRDLLRGIDLKRSRFFVTINSPKTFLRIVTVPRMPKGELREALRLEAAHLFPFPIDDSLFDFEVLGETVEKGIKKIQVAFAITPREDVNDTLALLKKVGVKPSSILPLPCALQSLASRANLREGQVQCWIDLGDRYTELLVLKGSQLVFSRKIPVAGSDFTQALTGVLVSDRGKTNLHLGEAEEVKHEAGIPAEGETRIFANKVSATQVLSMLHSPLEQLVGEISRSFDYYREETQGGEVESLVLFGRGALLKGLTRYLSGELGIEVSVSEGVPFAGARGAALSEGKGMNLLPPEIREETRRTLTRATIQALGVSTVLILAFLYIGIGIQLGNYQKRIATAQFELSALETELERVRKESLENQVLAGEPYWEEVFKELSNRIPGGIYLTAWGMEKRRIHLKGTVVAREKEEVLSHFILDLENGIFRNVKLITAKETGDKTASEFELQGWMD